MKRLTLLLALILGATTTLAQTSGVAYRLRGGNLAQRPTTCKATAPADQYYAVDNDTEYVCDSPNHWKILATATIGGPGNVVGPASAVDNHLAVFDGTTGKLIKDGGAIPSATPAGSDTQVQFNDGGAVFGGDAGLLYNKTTDTLTAGAFAGPLTGNVTGNVSGTAGGLSGTPALPNGTTATTQSQADASTKIATTAYVDTGLAGKQSTLTNSAGLRGALSDENGTGAALFDGATSPTFVAPALGTPSALVGTNITGIAAGFTAGNVTTNANLTGDVTSVGNATAIASGVIVNADVNASAAIGATKLVDGTVSDAELQFINTLSSNAQTQIDAKSPTASPTFTGVPAAPTAAVDTATTQLATTAYVVNQAYAKLASPTFSGTPSLPTGTTATTQSAADSTTKLATTAFVTTADNLKANLASPTFSGTVSVGTGNYVGKYYLDQQGKYLFGDAGTNQVVAMGSVRFMGWAATDGWNGTLDTTMFRSAAGVVGFGTTGVTANGSIAASQFTFSGATQTLSNAAFTTCTALTTTANVLGCTVSDRNLKQYFRPFKGGIDFIRNVRPQVYSFRKGTQWYDGGRTRLGLIAQDVQKALPNAVFPTGPSQPLQIDYNAVTAATVDAIKTLDARVLAQDARLSALETENKRLHARLRRAQRRR